MTEYWWAYLSVMLGTVALSAGLAAIVSEVVSRLNMFYSWSDFKLPSHGIYAAAITATFVIAVPASSMIQPLAGGREGFAAVLVITVALFVAGLVEEQFKLLRSWCLGANIAGATVVWAIGGGVMLQGQIPAVVGLGLTVLWFVMIIDAFRLIDGTGGFSTGLTAIACLSIFAIALSNGQVLLAVLSIAFAGCILGVLAHSRESSHMFLGKGGTQLAGFLVAYFGLRLFRVNSNFIVSALIPILICSVVLFNWLVVLAGRVLLEQASTIKERYSLSYWLLSIGCRPPVALAILYLGASAAGMSAYLMNRTDSIIGLSIASLVGLSFLGIGVRLFQISQARQSESRISAR